MAQEAGVGLSALSKEFPSLSSFPHGSSDNFRFCMENSNNIMYNINNKSVIDETGGVGTIISTFSQGSEGLRKVRETEVQGVESDYERMFAYNGISSDNF